MKTVKLRIDGAFGRDQLSGILSSNGYKVWQVNNQKTKKFITDETKYHVCFEIKDKEVK